MPIEKYVVEGGNFMATVQVDTDLCSCPYTEAATRVLEYIFRHGPDSEESGKFHLMCKSESPAVGEYMSIVKDGDIGNDDKTMWILTEAVATNAGCLEIATYFKS